MDSTLEQSNRITSLTRRQVPPRDAQRIDCVILSTERMKAATAADKVTNIKDRRSLEGERYLGPGGVHWGRRYSESRREPRPRRDKVPPADSGE